MTIIIEQQTEPSSPPSGFLEIYNDSNDNNYVKTKDSNGNITTLSENDTPVNSAMNGGFAIQQRVATASTAITGISTTTRAGVVADRWAVTTSVASNLNWQQVDTSGAPETNLQSRFYGSIISSTAGKKVMLSQFIINREMAHLRGRKVRLQVKVNQKVGSTSQKYKLGLLQLNASGTTDTCPAFLSGAWSTTTGVDPSWGTNLAAIAPDSSPSGENGTINGSYLEISTTAAWVRSGCVFTIPSTAKNLVIVLFADATGGTTDNISIAEFALYEGPEKRDWSEEPFMDNLSKCQQYFCKTFTYGTVPAQNAGINTGEAKGICGKANAANGCMIFWRFPVTMWKTPVTVTGYNPAAANAQIRDITGSLDSSASTFTAQLDSSVMCIATSNATSAVGAQIGLHITADAEIVN